MLTNRLRSLLQFFASRTTYQWNCCVVVRQIGVPAVVVWLVMSCSLVTAGVWTQVATPSPAGGSGTMLLLTDGTVMVQQSDVSSTWNKLTPGSSGNYVNGTWSSIASMGTPRLYYGSNVLPSGQVFVLGGEYTNPFGGRTDDNTSEIYDPVANTWTPKASFPKFEFGDDPTVLLPNGKILAGYLSGSQTYLYTPPSSSSPFDLGSWAKTAGNKLRLDASDEETWCLLPDGSVISYDVFGSPDTGPGHAQRYVPSMDKWVNAGIVPVPLTSDALGRELGPATLLPDGRFFQVGANTNTVIYTPSTNQWVQGPSLPAKMGSDDAPGAMLPNGHFIFAADTSVPNFTPPTKLFDFDPVANTLTDVALASPYPAALASELASAPAYTGRMLVLPNGHILYTTGNGNTLWDYAPDGAPNSAWAPTITSVIKGPTGTTYYTLTGTQLTGLSEGASYGDDAEMSSNYPIVRLTNSTGVVKYARTFNWTPGVADPVSRTVQFTLPVGLANGTYQLAVIANGIASTNRSFALGTAVVSSVVTTTYAPGTKTLTLTGDDLANSLTVTLQNGKINIEAANGTKLTNLDTVQSNLVSTSYPTTGTFTGSLILVAVLNGGNDSLSIVGVDSSKTDVKLGSGDDKAAITLCNITTLSLDGGTNNPVTLTNLGDLYSITSSTFGPVPALPAKQSTSPLPGTVINFLP